MRLVAGFIVAVVMLFSMALPAQAVAFPFSAPNGVVLSETNEQIVVRSVEPVWKVQARLDFVYVRQNGCVKRLAVDKPRDYFCNGTEIVWTFAALEFTPGGFQSESIGTVVDNSGQG